MEYLIWFGFFIVLAVLATVPVHLHLSSMKGNQVATGPEASTGRGQTRSCPHCNHPTSVNAAFCDKCGVPMMLWTLKAAREAKGEDASGLVPIIDQDMCIGCSACVDACETDVLSIVAGKSAVTNINTCTSAGTCAMVCPTGACQLGGTGAARRIEVPRIDEDFQTNQRGIYAVGELGGLGLIKNAVAEGQLVVERIARHHQRREGILDLVIIGGGPAGLSAGLAAKSLGLEAKILEQGTFANTIQRYPNRKVVMAEPVKIPLYGSLWVSDAPKETLLAVWKTIVDSSGIHINENERVLRIEAAADGLIRTQSSKAEYVSQKVILAIGKRGTPRELPAKGSDHPKVLYHLTDAAQYKDQNILVVGGGDSAAEAAVALSRQQGNKVTLSYRKTAFTRLREKNEAGLTARAAEGAIRMALGTEVAEILDGQVLLRTSDGRVEQLENDFVFAFLGGTSPKDFLENIGIEMVTKEVSLEKFDVESRIA